VSLPRTIVSPYRETRRHKQVIHHVAEEGSEHGRCRRLLPII